MVTLKGGKSEESLSLLTGQYLTPALIKFSPIFMKDRVHYPQRPDLVQPTCLAKQSRGIPGATDLRKGRRPGVGRDGDTVHPAKWGRVERSLCWQEDETAPENRVYRGA